MAEKAFVPTQDGTYIVGEFLGKFDGDFGPEVHLKSDNPSFPDRVKIGPKFNPETGEAISFDGLLQGQRVAIVVTQDVLRSKMGQMFVISTAQGVWPVGDGVSAADALAAARAS